MSQHLNEIREKNKCGVIAQTLSAWVLKKKKKKVSQNFDKFIVFKSNKVRMTASSASGMKIILNFIGRHL